MLTDLVTESANVEPSSFRFLDLPFELRSQIIKISITNNIAQRKKQRDNPRNRFETEPHGVTISAAGLKCRFLAPLNLFSVSRQIRRESMAIAFHDTSVRLQVKLPRYGGLSDVATSVSGNLDVLKAYPLLCDSAREVTVIFQPERAYASGPLIETNDMGPPPPPPQRGHRERSIGLVLFGLIYYAGVSVMALAKLASLVHRSMSFQKRHVDLQTLIKTIALGFRSRKSLKIILYLNDLYFQDLKIILDLFEAPSGSISLEERWILLEEPWIQVHHPNTQERMVRNYEVEYKGLVGAATQEAGHELLSTVCPSLEELDVSYDSDDFDKRGRKILGRRRRVWLD